MTDFTTLPLQAHDDRSLFLQRAWNIGRAYRNQAIELISICQLLSRLAPPKLAHEDAELRRMRRACDLALRSAANSGTKVTDEANALFKEATQMLSNYSGSLDLPFIACSKMEIAEHKDSLERDWPLAHVKSDECEPTMTINFVLLRSPLLSPRDPETIIVSQELSARSQLPEILWNFSRYKGHARITLEQNPHFYLRCPADESVYTPMFQRHPLRDTSGALEHNDTLYVLFDRPSRIFLHTEHESRIFGNTWMLNGSLIFRDSFGVLEGEKLVRSTSTQYKFRYCEQLVVYHDPESHSRLNHRSLRSIVTTPLVNPSSDGEFEDWTALSRPASHSIDIHISGLRGYPGSTSSLDITPRSPTSERPEYRALYTTFNTLEDDIILGIFNHYRLADEIAWNLQLKWCKLSHVCRRWRQLIYSSTYHLGMHVLCTNGTPIVDTLDHLPPLPLFVDYLDDYLNVEVRAAGRRRQQRKVARAVTGEDEVSIFHALRLRERACRIELHLSPSTLDKCLILMDKSFPILERLSLSSAPNDITPLILPTTFLAPNLRNLSLSGIRLPKRFRLLSSTFSLVRLELLNIQASGYFRPRLLLARLQLLPQLEELSIGFSAPLPRPGTERLLLGKQGTPVILSNLKTLTFRGVSTYLEHLVSQIRAPLLNRSDIELFNQLAFTLPHLSHFAYIAEQINPYATKVIFDSNKVSIVMVDSTELYDDDYDSHDSDDCYNSDDRVHSNNSDNNDNNDARKRFALHVMCKPRDWQIDCAAQICSALMPTLSGVEELTLMSREPITWIGLLNHEIDGATWHELLRSFVGVKDLRIGYSLSEELSRALEVGEIGSDPGLLPGLQELVGECYRRANGDHLFGSFTHARQVAGRPVSLRLQLPPPSSGTMPALMPRPFYNVHPAFSHAGGG